MKTNKYIFNYKLTINNLDINDVESFFYTDFKKYKSEEIRILNYLNNNEYKYIIDLLDIKENDEECIFTFEFYIDFWSN